MRAPGGRLRAWIGFERNPSEAVYGIIATGALLAAESDHPAGYGAAVASAAVTLSLAWVAHAYADALGHQLDAKERLSVRSLLRALIHDSVLIRGAALPLLVLLVCWAAGASQSTGLNVALWTAVASLVLFEVVAGLRSGARGGGLVLEAATGAAMGLAVIALKLLLE